MMASQPVLTSNVANPRLISEADIVKVFQESSTGRLTVPDLIDRFRKYLKDDQFKKKNRQLFQHIIDTVAIVDDSIEGEQKVLILKQQAELELQNAKVKPKAKIVQVPTATNETHHVKVQRPPPLAATPAITSTPTQPTERVTQPTESVTQPTESVTTPTPNKFDTQHDTTTVQIVEPTPPIEIITTTPKDTPHDQPPPPQRQHQQQQLQLQHQQLQLQQQQRQHQHIEQHIEQPPLPPQQQQQQHSLEHIEIDPSEVPLATATQLQEESLPPLLRQKSKAEDFISRARQIELMRQVSSVPEDGRNLAMFRSRWKKVHTNTGQRIVTSCLDDLFSDKQSDEKLWLRAAAIGGARALKICKTIADRIPAITSQQEPFDGYTALHWAAKRGDESLLDIIAATNDFDVNAKSRGGYTPLHLACMYGRHLIQGRLKDLGANEKLTTHGGHSSRSLRQQWMEDQSDKDEVDHPTWTELDYVQYEPAHKKKTLGRILRAASNAAGSFVRRSSAADELPSKAKIADAKFKAPLPPTKKKDKKFGTLRNGLSSIKHMTKRSSKDKLKSKSEKELPLQERRDSTPTTVLRAQSHESMLLTRTQSCDDVSSFSKPPTTIKNNMWRSLDDLSSV